MLIWSEPKTVEQIEAFHSHPELKDPIYQLPFQYLNARWEELKARIWPGDVLREFTSEQWTWRALAGREGVALIRDGDVVDEIVTRLS